MFHLTTHFVWYVWLKATKWKRSASFVRGFHILRWWRRRWVHWDEPAESWPGLAQGKFILGNTWKGGQDSGYGEVGSRGWWNLLSSGCRNPRTSELCIRFYMSRALKFVLNKFDEAARQVDNWTSHLSELCELIILLMTSMPPREFTAEAMSVPHLVFTDGAWEQGEATAGLYFCVRCGTKSDFSRSYIGPWCPYRYLEARGWRAAHMPNWAFCFLGSEVLLCRQDAQQSSYSLDWQWSSTFCSTKGTATSPSLAAMTRVLLEGTKPSLIWTEREVASFSSPADEPSRGKGVQSAQAFGGTFVEQPLEVTQEVVDAIVKLTKTPYAVLPSFEWLGNLTRSGWHKVLRGCFEMSWWGSLEVK